MRKKRRSALTSLMLCASLSTMLPVLPVLAEEEVTAPEAYGPVPSAGQMKYYKEEMAGFVHFGVNTFTNKEWGDGTEDPDIFNPTKLNTDQWVKTFKDAGFGRVILTAKHHDGFNLYPTSISDHSVKSSSWKDGKGDVVQDFVNSTVKYNMGLGFYLSPWDQNLPSYSKDVDPDYNDTYITQMQELFKYASDAGTKVVEFWMDGACGDVSTRPKYDLKRWWGMLESLNPDIVYQQNYGANLRWIGNESGQGSDQCWQTINKEYVWDLYDQYGQEDANYLHTGEPYIEGKEKTANMWSIPETDVSIRSGWFYHSNQTPKSLEQLAELYFSSVGLGSPLLLNVPPNQEGLLDSKDVESLKGFREILDNTFDEDLSENASISASEVRGNAETYSAAMAVDDDYDTYWTMDDGKTTGSLTIDFDSPQYMDVIEIQEYIPLGQRISSFKTEVKVNGSWMDYGSGGTIGYKRLVKGVPVIADAVRVTITGSYAVPLINNVGVYKADERIAEEGRTAPGRFEAEDFDEKQGGPYAQVNDGVGNIGSIRDGDWICFKNVNFLQNPASFTLRYGAINNIALELRLDSPTGQLVSSMTTEKTGDYIAWTETTFPFEEGVSISGMHDVYLCLHAGLNIDWLQFDGRNAISFKDKNLTVLEGEPVNVTLVRSQEDLDSSCSVTLETAPGTAVHGRHYEDLSTQVVFAPGEKEKTVTIQTIDNEEKSGNLQFTAVLKNASSNAMVNADNKVTITITDNDSVDVSRLEELVSQAEGYKESEVHPSCWKALSDALSRGRELLGQEERQANDVIHAIEALEAAIAAIRPFAYDADNPLVLADGANVSVEAEQMVLQGTAQTYSRNGASGLEVINVGHTPNGSVNGSVEMTFTVENPGILDVNMRYFTGAQNVMKWILDDDPASVSQKKLNWTGTASYHTDTFSIKVPGAGTHTLRFYNDEAGTCNPDRFDLHYAEIDPDTMANKVLLSATIAHAQSLKDAGALEGVNTLVVNAFESALDEAKKLEADPWASQDAVNEAWLSLSKAIHMLDFKTDKSELNALIAQGSIIEANLKKYQLDGQEEFKAALENARSVAAREDVLTSQSIQAAIDALQSAMNGLTPRGEFNTFVLEFLLKKAEGIRREDCMSDTLAELDAAAAHGKEVLADPQNQARVDEAADRLNQAYLNLRYKADEELLRKLKAALDEYKTIDRTLFSAVELAEMDNVFNEIEALIHAPEAEKEQAQSLLEKAQSYLSEAKARKQNVNKPGTQDNPNLQNPNAGDASQTKPSASHSVKTAAGLGSALYGFGASAAAAAWMVLRRKRK